MRLSSVRPSVVKLPLTAPGSSEPVGITLHLIGRDSPQFQALSADVLEKRQAGEHLDPTELAIRVITTVVVGCDEDDAFDGPFSQEKLADLLKTGEYGWLAEQVNKKLDDRAVFFKGSLANSASA